MKSVVIVCPSCQRPNRAPQERLDEKAIPLCGKCQSPLFDGHPVEISKEADFNQMIARNEIPVIVDFWASWCGPCKAMAPHFEAASKDMQPRVRFAKVETEALPSVAARFGVRSIPTLILFHEGREVARQSGAMDKKRIVDLIERAGSRWGGAPRQAD